MMDRLQESTLSGYGRQWIQEIPTFSTMDRSQEEPLYQESTHEEDCLEFKLSSGIPILSNSVNYSSGEPNRAISVKATEVVETHDRVKMKSGIISAPQQTIVDEPVVESVAGEVATEIEFAAFAAEIELNLLNDGNEPVVESVVDPFTIKKKLTSSDVKLSLYLGKDLVTEHIRPFLNDKQKNLIEIDGKDGGGAIIKIFHRETNSEYEMKIQKCKAGYAFKKSWTKRFVTNMNIEEGDTFGMYWNRDASRFVFSFFKQSPVLSL